MRNGIPMDIVRKNADNNGKKKDTGVGRSEENSKFAPLIGKAGFKEPPAFH